MSTIRTFALAAFLAGAAFNAAQADATLFYNLDQGTTGTPPVATPVGPLAQSFSAGGLGAGLSLVQVIAEVGDHTDGGSFVVTLNSDSAGAPGSVLAVLGTVMDSFFTADNTHQTLSFATFGTAGYGTLLTDATYWISISDADLTGTTPTSAFWHLSATDQGVGVAGQNYQIAGSINAATDGTPFALNVEAPEPVSLAILGVGLAGLGFARSRRKQAASKV